MGDIEDLPYLGGAYEIPDTCDIPGCNKDSAAALASRPHDEGAPVVAWFCKQHADDLTVAGVPLDEPWPTCGAGVRGVPCGGTVTHVVVLEKDRRLAVLGVCSKHAADAP